MMSLLKRQKANNLQPLHLEGFDNGQTKQWPCWLAALIIVLLTFTAYYPAIDGEFVWDDAGHFSSNPLMTAPDGLRRLWFSTDNLAYYPLTFTTFWVERRLWGLQPMGYHMVNIAFHAVNAVLVWLLLSRLGIRGAWMAGAIFALHPVHVESVAWITERKNVLSGFFYLLALGSYLRFVTHRRWQWYGWALVLFLLALLSKTSTVMLPVVLLLCVWWSNRSLRLLDILKTLPFFALSALMSGLTVWFEHNYTMGGVDEWNAGLPERIAVAGKIIWFYLSKMLVPYDLTFVYPRWSIDPWAITAYLPAALLLVFGTIIWWQRRGWGRPILAGLGYFVVSLVPVMGFISMYYYRYSFVADHFQYLASVGLIALIVGSVSWGLDNVSWLKVANIPNRRNLLKVSIGFMVLVVLGILTWRQGHIYQDSETLWRDTLTKNSETWLAHNNLGAILKRQGKLEEAIKHFQEALRVRPSYAGTYFNLGLAMFEQGKLDMAVEYYQQALRIKPSFVEAHYKLGIVLAQQGKLDRAIEHYLHALQINPDFVNVHNNLGLAYAERGLLDLAIAEYKEALRTTPDSFYILNNLGLVYKQKNQIERAITEFKVAIRINPDYHLAHYNLGNAYHIKGLREMAITEFKEAIKINPHNYLAHYNLGIIYSTEGLLNLSIAEFEEALRVNPDFEEARENLNRVMHLRGS